jgi:hypothetical protein
MDEMVNSRTGKTDVNPLTRPSSRSVMGLNYSVAAVEGAGRDRRFTVNAGLLGNQPI